MKTLAAIALAFCTALSTPVAFAAGGYSASFSFGPLSGDVTTPSAGSFVTSVVAIQGVSLTGATGTGKAVLSISPTFTGTVNGAAGNFSSTLISNGFIGPVLESAAVDVCIGTGNGGFLDGTLICGKYVGGAATVNNLYVIPSISGAGTLIIEPNPSVGDAAISMFFPAKSTGVDVIGALPSGTPTARTLQVGESTIAGTSSNVGGSNGTITSGNGTGTGTSSSLIFQTPATTTSGSGAQTLTTDLTLVSGTTTISTAAFLTPNLASSGAALAYDCVNSATGAHTYDATTCTTSSEESKDIFERITGLEANTDIMKFQPFWGKYKDSETGTYDHAVHPMFGAHQIESIDPRLAAYDPKGKLIGVRYLEMSALLTTSQQFEQHEIDALAAKIPDGIATLTSAQAAADPLTELRQRSDFQQKEIDGLFVLVILLGGVVAIQRKQR